MKIIIQQQQEFQKTLLQQMQWEWIEYQEQIKAIPEKQGTDNASISFLPDSVTNSISEFNYITEENITFLSYFRRYETIFSEECQSWSKRRYVFCYENFAPLNMKNIWISFCWILQKNCHLTKQCQYYQKSLVKRICCFMHVGSAWTLLRTKVKILSHIPVKSTMSVRNLNWMNYP